MTPCALVVDDDQSMVRTLSDVLALSGWEVTRALSGRDAVEHVSARPFDVVLMDVKMPGMNGVAAFKAMKAARPNVRVILMTAYAEQELLEEAKREGAVRIMPKPVDLRALITLITAQLEQRKPILVVDHDAAFLKTLSEVLALCGLETTVAADLAEATRLMEARHPVAVLLHMHLPSIETHTAVATVHRADPATALILYSGLAGAGKELDGTIPSDWIHAYLQKPFAIEDVKRVLDAIR
ncbi:MAG: response regulator [Gemmatimonadota bacterium]